MRTIPLVMLAALLMVGTGCFGTGANSSNGGNQSPGGQNEGSGRASDAVRSYPLDSLATADVSASGHTFRVWLAQDFDTSRPGIVSEGLMHVPPEEIADDEGMLFVFSDERVRSFWMLNTLTPLDVAFARSDGEIVRIAQMQPQTLDLHSSIEPAMFALELKQGTFAGLGIAEGDRLVFPAEVFKAQP